MFGSRGRQRQPQDLEAVFKTLGRFKIRAALASLVYVAISLSIKADGSVAEIPLASISGLRLISYALALGAGTILHWLSKGVLAPRGVGDQLLLSLRRSFFAVLGIFEVPIFLGLVIYFVSGAVIDLYILTAYAMVLLATFAPRFDTWHAHEQREGQFSLRTPEEAQE